MIHLEDKNLFFNVYPNLKLNSKLNELFEEVVIEKAEFFMSKKELHLHILSKRIIHKQYIFAMEEAIRELNPYEKHTVIIRERFELSAQYTVATVTREYKSSLLFEVQHNSLQNFRHIKKSEWSIKDNVITINMDDSFLVRARAPQIREFIERVYMDRFNLEVNVDFHYSEVNRDLLQKAKDKKMEIESPFMNIEETSDDQIKELSEDNLHQVSQQDDKSQSIVGSKKKEEKKNLSKKDKEIEKKPIKSNYVRGGRNAGNLDPDIIYGRNVEGNIIEITNVIEGYDAVVIRGQIINIEEREMRSGEKTIITFSITDFTDTINGKLFIPNDDMPVLREEFKKKNFYLVKGMPVFDNYSKELVISSITGIKQSSDFREVRKDNALEKRVELHMHTVMSDMDSVVDIGGIIKRAKSWGHPAIAITDHGVAQAFPIANHILPHDDPFKIIYGVEGYFVDDLKELVIHSKGQSLEDSFVVFDIETTGLSPKHNKIIEIGGVKIVNGIEVERFSEFINPEVPIPYTIEKLTNINDDMVIQAPLIDEVLPRFFEFAKDSVLVAHNANFDVGFI